MQRRTRISMGLTALCILVSLVFGSMAVAPTRAAVAAAPSLTVTPTTIALGAQASITGAGFAPNEAIAITISQIATPLATLTAQPDGTLPASRITIPVTVSVGSQVLAISPGAHTLTLTGQASRVTVSDQITLIPSLTVSSSSLPLGGQLSIMAAGFAANERVSVSLSQMPTPLVTLVAKPDGVIAETALTVPITFTAGAQVLALSPGTHILTLSGASSQRTASATITVLPTVSVSPSTVLLGGQLSISAAGFAAGERVSVSLSQLSSALITLQASSAGLVSPTPVIIPQTAPPGVHTLTLTGATSGRTASVQVTLVPPVVVASITAAPSTIRQGGRFTISGSGFVSNEPVAITIQGLSTPLGTITTNAAGQIAPTILLIPATLSPGAHMMQASGRASGRTAATSITVAATPPAVAVSPLPLRQGALVTVSGQGFGAQEQIAIFLNGTRLATTPATVVTTADGTFTATFSVPGSGLNTANTITVSGQTSGAQASATVTGVLPPPAPLYFAGFASAVSDQARGTTAAKGVHWQLQVAMNLRPTPNLAPTSSLLIPAGTRVKEWGAQPSGGWVHITWQAHDGYLLASNMLPLGTSAALAPGQTDLAILNSTARAAHIDLTFYYQNGAAPGHASLVVAAHSRHTAHLNALAGQEHVLGLKLSADQPVSAQMIVRRPGRDGTVLQGTSTLHTTWYLAEGYTGHDFTERLVLVNPGTVPATVQLRLLSAAGHGERMTTLSLAPQSTQIVDVNRLAPRQSVGIIAISSQPIVLARTITFGPDHYGATAKLGIATPATQWLFAHARVTERAHTYLSVLNPNAAGTTVTATYYGPHGRTLGRQTVYLSAATRATIDPGQSVSGGEIATVVTSSLPVVAEEPSYARIPGRPHMAGSILRGHSSAATDWVFPGGDRQMGDATLYLFDPSSRGAMVDATFYGADGQVVIKRFIAPPWGQAIVPLTAPAPHFAARYGMTLHAINGVGIVAATVVTTPHGVSVSGMQSATS